MKIFRQILGVLGFSTLHLHHCSLFNPTLSSEVIPEFKFQSTDELLGQVEIDYKKDFKFKIIPFDDDDSLPVTICHKKKNQKYSRPPHIKPTRIPRYPQSNHRRR